MVTDLQLAETIKEVYDETVTMFRHASIEYTVRVTHANVIIALRGTTNIRDWFNNFRILPVPTRHFGMVHAGFYINARHSMKKLEEVLDFENNWDRPLVFTGHSKGGPEAIVMARLAQLRGWTVDRVVTFGAPQFISGSGAEKLANNLKMDQYIMRGDPVPKLPSDRVDWYIHPGRITSCTPLSGLDPIQRHNITSYIDTLKSNGCAPIGSTLQ